MFIKFELLFPTAFMFFSCISIFSQCFASDAAVAGQEEGKVPFRNGVVLQRLQLYKQRAQFQNLRSRGSNGRVMKTVLPRLVFWRKQRLERIQRQRMQQCIQMLNEQICNNRGSFYQWGKIIAKRIRNGEFGKVSSK